MSRCGKQHSFEPMGAQAGIRRLTCANCGEVVVDLTTSVEEGVVSAAGLFRPKPPTIFSVLGEDLRAEQRNREVVAESSGSDPSERYAFGMAQ